MLPDLNAVHFDCSGWSDRGISDGEHIWLFDLGGVILSSFDQVPDLPRASSLSELADQLRANMGGAALVELDVVVIDRMRCLRQVIRQRSGPPPEGLAYVASLTIPFTDHSFVVRVQSVERQPTGMRESDVMVKALGDGRVSAVGGGLQGWVPEPAPGFPRLDTNLSEAVAADRDHPRHPLTLVREALNHVQSSLTITARPGAVPFTLPDGL